MAKVVMVAIALVFDRARSHVLVCQRKPDAALGGYWELPGGKCEPGEAAVDCARRELAEEVGIEADAVAALPMIAHEYEHAAVRLHPFVCVHRRGTPRAIEVTQLRWVRPAELGAYRFPEGNAQLTELAMRGYEALVRSSASW